MLTISHALIGASLAVRIANPILSFLIAIIVHFICDLIPHWDAGTDRRKRTARQTFILALIDLIIALILTYFIFSTKVQFLYLTSMFFVSTLPDWIEAPYLFLGWDRFPFGIMYRLQSRLQNKLQLPLGLITQIITVWLFYYFLVAH